MLCKFVIISRGHIISLSDLWKAKPFFILSRQFGFISWFVNNKKICVEVTLGLEGEECYKEGTGEETL